MVTPYFAYVAHWTGDNGTVKEVENNPYPSARIMLLLNQFVALLVLLISSVSAEQSQVCVKNSAIHQMTNKKKTFSVTTKSQSVVEAFTVLCTLSCQNWSFTGTS